MTKSLPKRVIELTFDMAAGAVIVIDALARPLYRPLIEWASRNEFLKAAEAQVAELPRGVILILFAVPFVIAEPAKILALVWIAEGSVPGGIILLAISYLATFLLIERIYHAGRDKLLTYGWFAWSIRHLSIVREKMVQARQRMASHLSSLFR